MDYNRKGSQIMSDTTTTILQQQPTILQQQPTLQAIRLTDPAILAVPTTTSVDTVIAGETWTITAPNDIKVTTPENNNGVLKFDIQYTDNSLLNGQYHGIDSVTIKPAVDGVDNLSGFKAPVEFDVTNNMSVPIGGFDIMTFNETPVGTPDANNPSGHPSNYAHFHGLSPNAFIPEIVTTYLPNFQGSGSSPSSELRAVGTMQPGDMVKANIATFHSAEIGGAKNGFGFNFFPTDNVNPTTSPVISGLPASEANDGVPPFLPFANVTVTDTNVLPVERATLTVKDSNGDLTDSDPLTGTGLTHDSVGTYSMVSLPKELTEQLHTVQFKDNSAQINTLTLKVDNSGNNSFPAPAVASTIVSLIPPTSTNGTIVTTDGPVIKAASGDEWSIKNGQVAVNGVADSTTARVVALVYKDGKVWQENADKNWWAKTTPTDSWAPGQGTATPPVAGVTLAVSANNTVLTGGVQTIIDTNQHTWSIVNGQVSVDGQIDGTTARVIELAYENGQVWQENADNLWWAKTTPGDQWLPNPGTPVSPVTEPGVAAQPVLAMPDTAAVTSETLGMPQPSFLQLINDPAATADDSLPANPLGVVGVASSDFVTASGPLADPYTPPAPASFGFVTPDDPSLLAMVMHNHG
jgi:hypothetical protein